MESAKQVTLSKGILDRGHGCVVCHGKDFKPRIAVPFWALGQALPGKVYEAVTDKDAFYLVQCENCKLVFLDPLPGDPEYFHLVYEASGEYPDQTEGNFPRLERDLEILQPYRIDGKILDVGIGSGIFLKLARQQGWEPYGLELNPRKAQSPSLPS